MAKNLNRFWPTLLALLAALSDMVLNLPDYNLPLGVWFLLAGLIVQSIILTRELHAKDNASPILIPKKIIPHVPRLRESAVSHDKNEQLVVDSAAYFLLEIVNSPKIKYGSPIATNAYAMICAFTKRGDAISTQPYRGVWGKYAEYILLEGFEDVVTIDSNNLPVHLLLARQRTLLRGAKGDKKREVRIEFSLIERSNVDDSFYGVTTNYKVLGIEDIYFRVVMNGSNIEPVIFWAHINRSTGGSVIKKPPFKVKDKHNDNC